MRRILTRGRTDDRGTTMAEALVSMVVAALLLVGISTLVIGGVRSVDGSNQRNSAVGQMRVATDRMTKLIRTTASPDGVLSAVIVARPQEIGFYTRQNTIDLTQANAGSQSEVPSMVWLWTRPGASGTLDLCQQVVRGVSSGSSFTFTPSAATLATTSNRTCRRVSTGLSTSAPRPLFTYLSNGDVTTRADGSSISSVPVDGSNAVVGTDRALIDSVELWLTYDLRTQNASRDASTVARVTFVNDATGGN